MVEKEKSNERQAACVHPGPPPDFGKVIQEREIPSDVALVTPLIIRLTEFLLEENVITSDFTSKFQLCLDEALRNAVIHGNRKEFGKKVRLRAFVNEAQWGVQIEDEGQGFALDRVPDPLADGSLWGESGRGIRLMELYMDRVEYYCGGRVLVMAKDL